MTTKTKKPASAVAVGALSVQLGIYRQDIHKLFVGHEQVALEFRETSREHSRKMLARFFQIGTILMSEDNAKEYADLIIDNGLQQRMGDNPWATVVHLVMPDTKINKTWVNRAPNLRAMQRFCKDPNTAREWIEKLDLSDDIFRKETDHHGRTVATLVGDSKSTGINALLILDKAVQRSPTAPAEESENTAIDRAVRAKITIKPEDIAAIPESRKVVSAWCRVEDGKLVIGGLLDDNKAARKAAALAGRAISAKRNEQAAAVVAEPKVGFVMVPSDTIEQLEMAE